jgi:hypothetical protein
VAYGVGWASRFDPFEGFVRPRRWLDLFIGERSGDVATEILAALYGTTVVSGYATSIFLGWLGLKRRKLLTTTWVLVLTPLHWLRLSLAAWRALGRLVVAPYVWEKTEHGLAKSSRRAAAMTRLLLQLERRLTVLAYNGLLPDIGTRATNISAAPPPLRRVAA